MMACNGKLTPIPSRLPIIRDVDNVEVMKTYYENREYGHYICLKYPKKCKKTKKLSKTTDVLMIE